MKYLAKKLHVIIDSAFLTVFGAGIITICLLELYLAAIPFVIIFCLFFAWLIIDCTTTITVNEDCILYKRLNRKIVLTSSDIKKCTIGAIHPSRPQDYSLIIQGKHGEEFEVLLDLNFKLIDIILKAIPRERIKAEYNLNLRKANKKFLDKVKPYLTGKEYKKFFE